MMDSCGAPHLFPMPGTRSTCPRARAPAMTIAAFAPTTTTACNTLGFHRNVSTCFSPADRIRVLPGRLVIFYSGSKYVATTMRAFAEAYLAPFTQLPMLLSGSLNPVHIVCSCAVTGTTVNWEKSFELLGYLFMELEMLCRPHAKRYDGVSNTASTLEYLDNTTKVVIPIGLNSLLRSGNAQQGGPGTICSFLHDIHLQHISCR